MNAPGIDRVRDAGLRRRDHALADRDVAGDADLPGQRHVVFDRRAAGDADLRREQHVAADRDAVRDLHEVVDLGAGADPRLANGRPIDRRVGADLDVVFDDDAADLRNLVVRAVGAPSRSRSRRCRSTAPSCRMTRLPMRTRSRIDTRAWMTQSSPISTPRPIDDVRVHDRARADPRAVADHGERADRRRRRRARRRRPTAASGCTPAGGRRGSAKSSTACANARYGCAMRSIAHGAASALSPKDHRRRARRAQRAQRTLGVGEEGQIAGTRRRRCRRRR